MENDKPTETNQVHPVNSAVTTIWTVLAVNDATGKTVRVPAGSYGCVRAVVGIDRVVDFTHIVNANPQRLRVRACDLDARFTDGRIA